MDKHIENWQLTSSMADEFSHPQELPADFIWQPAQVPGTVAQSLQQNNQWQLGEPQDFDAKDWWFQCNFAHSKPSEISQEISQEIHQKITHFLNFDGLATFAQVWLNGQLVLTSDNMFHSHRVDVSEYLLDNNQLVICFRSIDKYLSLKRPRPRWKTKLVNQQQLRWVRTSLLGHIPGWTPPVTAIGPWRAVSLSEDISISKVKQNCSVVKGNGIYEFDAVIHNAHELQNVVLRVGDHKLNLEIKQQGSQIVAFGKLVIPNVELWWPHTHGNPHLYRAELKVTTQQQTKSFPLANAGFKQVALDTQGEQFKIFVNEQLIFCRGACWTINDVISINGTQDKLRHNLTLMRDAGANMIRCIGTMVYEQDAFYEICDELGLMVWQDFMFANMDYPFSDEIFLQTVTKEVDQQVTRLAKHPCITMYCGGSEIEQQIAMLGFDKTVWDNPFLNQTLPDICQKIHPNIPYVSSSPTGGDLPFRANQGLSHYYGVGAYLRPLSELRNHKVKFTSECLGFSNVPAEQTRNTIFDGQIPATHDPKWKARQPRDSGTGWDFEDVRDHYLAELYAVDPIKLRSFNPDTYMRLSELVTGRLMSGAFSEWRSSHSQCNGGIVWFMNDLWPGAGWGIIDSLGTPKACYYFLKRTWQPINIMLTDETINGIDAHISNELNQDIELELNIKLINQHSATIAEVTENIKITKHSQSTFNIETLLGHFYDCAYTYRFGPANHHLVTATLVKDDEELSQALMYIGEGNNQPESQLVLVDEAELSTSAQAISDDEVELKLVSEKYLRAVVLDTNGYLADDNYFDLLPGATKSVLLKKNLGFNKKLKCFVSALNLNQEVKVKI